MRPQIQGAFKGTGTPSQLVLNLQRVVAREVKRPTSGDGYRSLMRAHGPRYRLLGVHLPRFERMVASNPPPTITTNS